MKILAIRGRNIASLEGDFVIDFTAEPLCSAGIFAISGPTGAGKSTLLDTMCLALFGCTPRTEQAKERNVKLNDVNSDLLVQGDPRFLLRRGCGSGYAEADFVALDGHRYRARWSVSRAREKAGGRLQAVGRTLQDLDEERIIGGNPSELQREIIQLVGLTFDQFTRSVLLAQNDFSTFLKADQNDKAALLEKLTGTEQYTRISKLIYAKCNEAREAFEQVQARIQGVELMDEKETEALRAHLERAEHEALQLEKQKEERQALREQLRSATEQHAAKQQQKQEAEARLARSLAQLETARQGYAKALGEQQLLEEESKRLLPDLRLARRLDTQLESCQRRLDGFRKSEGIARKQYEENERKFADAVKQCETNEREMADLTRWREKMEAKAPIAERLEALLLHIDAAAAARRTIAGATESLARHRRQLLEATQEADKLAAEREKLDTALQTAEKSLAECRKRLDVTDPDALRRTTDELAAERERLLVEQARGDIKELRAQLREGEPCPVCGSTQHPFRLLAAGTVMLHATRIRELTIRLEELRKQRDDYTACRAEADKLSRRQLDLHKQAGTGETRLRELAASRQLAASRIEQEEKSLAEQKEQLRRSLEAANGLFGNEDWQKNWEQDDAGFRKQLIAFAQKWRTANERLQTLRQAYGARIAERDSLLQFRPAFAKTLDEARQELASAEQEMRALQQERATLLGGRAADLVEREWTAKTEKVKAQLARLQQIQAEETAHAGQERGTTQQIAADLAAMEQAAARFRDALERWERQWREAVPDKSLDETLAENAKQRTEAAFRLRTQAENLGRVTRWKQEADGKRLIADRWMKLNELAGSSDGAKFRKIAQGYTLDVLLSYANVQLKNLTNRYSLMRVADTLALQVKDREMCDEIRTVHTLSGGESFLVSLALALGLSALSSNRMKVESLFIDEGFGSLDSETLRVAMDALENLRTQGRKIGVISHVQEMTERIPVQVRVLRGGNGRSFIETVVR